MAAHSNETLKVKRVFIGSPGDLAAERRLFKTIIERVNRTQAKRNGVLVEPVGWEDTLPGVGRPQEIINRDLAQCDLVVMLLWKRWGTPSGKYSSGFEEEYKLARRTKKDIILYFRDVPQEMLADAGEQLRNVLDFRSKIEDEKALLYKRYADEAEWETLFDEHLCDWLYDHLPTAPEPIKDAKAYEDTIAELKSALKAASTKQAEAALTLAVEAQSAADGGQLTKAEELFAKAVYTNSDWRVLKKYGGFLCRIGNLKGAMEKFEAVRAYGESANDAIALAAGLSNLGNIYGMQGDLKRAKQMHRKALAIHASLGLRGERGADHVNLGHDHWMQGDVKRAVAMWKKALLIFRRLGDKERLAVTYANLGYAYCEMGDLKRAEDICSKALAMNEAVGCQEGIAQSCGNLGSVFYRRGKLKRAEEMYRRALAVDERLGQKAGLADHCTGLGSVYYDRGDLTQAEEMYRKALDIYEQVGLKQGMADTCYNLAEAWMAKRNLDDAEEMARKSRAVYASLANKAQTKEAAALLARIRKQKRAAPSRPARRKA